MQRLTRGVLGALLLTALLAPLPVHAHHHVGCVYDTAAPRTMTGQVVEISWKFPHVHIRIAAPDGSPGGVTWDLETVNPQGLTRVGVGRETLKVGDRLIAAAWIAKDGSARGFTRSLTLTTGTTVAFPIADLSCPL